ncbi:MAG: hypothetical protein KTR20_12840 [Cellvibrionaceae bacterium]|nr:hypothetical protein [Cellvibrionaceae bacterium]
MIEAIVHELLVNDTQLGTLLSVDAIFHFYKPKGQDPEHYIVHYPINESRPLNLDLSADQRHVNYRIQCYSVDVQRTREIADRLDHMLNGYQVAVGSITVDRIFVDSLFPGFEEDGPSSQALHFVSLSLSIYYQ